MRDGDAPLPSIVIGSSVRDCGRASQEHQNKSVSVSGVWECVSECIVKEKI